MRGFLRKHYLLIIILVIGVFFRLYNLGTSNLHTDEAEVYLASQNILKSGVPKGFHRVPFYENAYLFESNTSMYEFAPTNYYKSDLVLKKGWLPYYLTAFFSLFGKNEFLLRFPFALIGVISLFFFFQLTNILFNKRTALIALFFYAISPSLLFYERMVRYYSPMILFIILSIYFYVKAFKEDNWKNYLLGAFSLVLLFYTNVLIFLSLVIVLFIFWFTKRIKINRNLIYSDLIIIALILPWILFSGFLWNIAKEPRQITAPVFQSITAGINNNGSLYFFFYLGIILLLINIIFKKKIHNKTFLWKNNSSNYLILIYLLALIIIPYLLAPSSSFEEKLFLSLIPFSLIIIAKLFDSIFKVSENNIFKYVVIILIVIISIVHIETAIGRKGHNIITLKEIINIDRNELYNDIEEVIKEQTSGNPLILTTSEQFPLMFYTDYSAQTIWPVREEFINNYDEELVIIETGFVEGTCNLFYRYVNPAVRCNNNKNYLDRINECKAFAMDETTNLYFCKKRKKFIGGGLGLFFPDFPENQPPDFIWDLEPFQVAVNVKNLGESNVDKLKIIFIQDFGGREFDTEKSEFLFNKKIAGRKKVSGEVITSEEFFDLGNVTFNHKLPLKLRYINASVKLCYPYITMLRINICNDSLNICNYDVSGGPMQINSVSYDELNFNFSIYNSAEGFLGNFENCQEDNMTKEIKVESDFFKCEKLKDEFRCQADVLKIRKDDYYLISINYDYQQEFKKGLLLRSKERNKYDYENFYKKE
ncbi:MAG: glycosyltransferase family 39 protein [Nanoarchaeota archaeon]|nr:glycosyltransferase family 39 protein [DPANN group archaeon]MBL7116567.1 glycosyltransferase family 39 protein [Nanoarchaeota archaeon]